MPSEVRLYLSDDQVAALYADHTVIRAHRSKNAHITWRIANAVLDELPEPPTSVVVSQLLAENEKLRRLVRHTSVCCANPCEECADAVDMVLNTDPICDHHWYWREFAKCWECDHCHAQSDDPGWRRDSERAR